MPQLIEPRKWFRLVLQLAVVLVSAVCAVGDLVAALAVLWGLCVGSFINVVVYRLPLMAHRRTAMSRFQGAALTGQLAALGVPPVGQPFNLAVPRSACPSCGHRISALENVPVLSYAILRGRCRGCQSPISARYPLVELACGALTFGAIAWQGPSLAGLTLVLASWLGLPLLLMAAARRTGYRPGL